MKIKRVAWLILGLIGLLALPGEVLAAVQEYTLQFLPTQHAPAGMEGAMTIKVDLDKPHTQVHFIVRGAYPNTVYTIWIVYNVLQSANPLANSMDASQRPGFPKEGNAVAPLARLDDAFTSGMGQDPGASFVTNEEGEGQITVNLDYDLVREAPVGNADIIAQSATVRCVPGVDTGFDAAGSPKPCGSSTVVKSQRMTTTWLRKFIGDLRADGTPEFPLEQRASKCANYDPVFDPESPQYDPVLSKGTDARRWQCVDLATGLPRVPRYVFDHFRLANHPDDLTHGFIGGDKSDHWIDMVGSYADLVPKEAGKSSAASGRR